VKDTDTSSGELIVVNSITILDGFQEFSLEELMLMDMQQHMRGNIDLDKIKKENQSSKAYNSREYSTFGRPREDNKNTSRCKNRYLISYFALLLIFVIDENSSNPFGQNNSASSNNFQRANTSAFTNSSMRL